MFWRLIDQSTNTFFIKIIDGYPAGIQSSFLYWIIIFVGLFLAIVIHEYFHALSAHLLGDDTAKLEGRLTLNPFRHFDLLGFALILFTFFGYGKPVPVNPNNFKNPIQGNMLVALAGPVSNVIQAAVYAILFLALKNIPVYQGSFQSIGSFSLGLLTAFIYALPMVGFINLSLAIFNMLPIPPLDGSKVWGYVHYKIDDFIHTYIAPYAMFIIFALILPVIGNSSILSLIMEPFSIIYFKILSI